MEAHPYADEPTAQARVFSQPLGLAPQDVPQVNKQVVGFYPYWIATATGTQQFQWDLLTVLCYFSVGIDGEGNVTSWNGWPSRAPIAEAHSHGVKVLLVASLFTSSQIRTLIQSPANRARFITNMVNTVQSAGADGINIDFELPYGSDKDYLVTFMQELSEAFHTQIPGSLVTLDTPAVDWSGAFRYNLLAPHVDHLFIMGYDYHYGGGNPGPVAPLVSTSPWTTGGVSITSTINTYLTGPSGVGLANASKIVLGLPYYGQDWPSVDNTIPGTKTANAKSRIYRVAEPAAIGYGKLWDNGSQTPYYFYTDGTGQFRQSWYEDDVAIGKKYDLVNQRNLGGTGMWALGYDHGRTEMWSMLRAKFYNGAPQKGSSENPFLVSDNPYVHISDTRNSLTSQWSSYNCASSTNEGGPEFVYKVDAACSGTLTASVEAWDGSDPDVHLLASLSSAACLTRGNINISRAIQAGTYYIVVDSWVSATGSVKSGPYSLRTDFTPDQMPCGTGVSAAETQIVDSGGDGKLSPGESAQYKVKIHNATGISRSEIRGQIWSASPDATFSDNSEYWGTLSNDAAQFSTIDGAFDLSVDGLAQPGTTVKVAFDIYQGTRQFLDSFESAGSWVADAAWARGVPTSGPLAALDGTQVYSTNLAGAYGNNADARLTSATITLPSGPNAILSFWHWFEFEPSKDGGAVELSTDDGSTWSLLTPVGGYSGSTANGPAFTGSSQGWKREMFDLSAVAPGSFRIRFRQRSDFATTRAGWYIDAVLVTEGAGSWTQPLVIPIQDPQSSGPAGNINMSAVPGSILADSISTLNISGTVRDNLSVLVPDGTRVTVSTSRGILQATDLDPVTLGLQVATVNGVFDVVLKAGNTWGTVSVNASSVVGSAAGTVAATFTNLPPSVSKPAISPETPQTANNLSLAYAYSDFNGDSEMGSQIRWYKNGVEQVALRDAPQVLAAQTARGQNWYATVRVSDGQLFGTLTTAATVGIGNTVPAFSAATNNGPRNQGLSATVTATATDADGDALTYEYDWGNDGVYEFVTLSNTNSKIFLQPGSYVVAVRVSDDTGYSIVRTTTVIVNNLAPSISSLTLPSVVGENEIFTAQITATDPGNDLLTYSFDWQNDGTYDVLDQFANQANASYTQHGVDTVKVRAKDPSGGSDTLTASIRTVIDTGVNPRLDMRTTSSGPTASLWSSYSCALGTNEGGPEFVYRIEAACSGTIKAGTISFSTADIDVHLLSAAAPGACLARNNTAITVNNVPAGTYFIVADTFVNGVGTPLTGPYSMRAEFIPDAYPCGAGLFPVHYDLTEVSGNNDGYLSPGETVDLRTKLLNYTGRNLTNVRAEIWSADPSVTITDNYEYWGTLANNASAFSGGGGVTDGKYTFSLSAGSATNRTLAFDVDLYEGIRQYRNDMEAADGWAVDGEWARGVPTSGPNAAHGGTRVYATNLTGNYSNSQNSSLRTGSVVVTAPQVWLTFWHWFSIEQQFDVGWVEVSTDGGTNWQKIYPIEGYPGRGVSAGSGYDELGFTGSSQGWKKESFNLSAFVPNTLQFRYRFRSDGATISSGWYIDSMMVTEGPAVHRQLLRVPVVNPLSVPSPSGNIGMSFDPSYIFADGVSVATIYGQVTDSAGSPVPDGIRLTLAISNGVILTPDVDAVTPGTQVATNTGTFTAQVRATTTVGNMLVSANSVSGTASGSLSIALANTPPAFTSTAILAAQENALYSYTLGASDLQGAISYFVVTGPVGFAISAGKYEGTPIYSQVGTWPVALTATDSHGALTQHNYSLTISFRDVDGDAVPDTWEQLYFGTIAHNAAADLDGDGLTNAQEFARGSNPSVFSGPGAPVPNLASGAIVATLTPMLTINAAIDPDGDALTYRYEIYSDPGLTNLVRSISGQGTGWAVTPALAENQTYYWRATAADAYVQGPFSAARSFQVDIANESPSAPGIASPADDARVAVLQPILTIANGIDPEGRTLRVTFEVANDTDFTQLVTSIDAVATVGATAWQVDTSLIENHIYFWRARMLDDGDNGSPLVGAAFLVDTENEAPSLAYFTNVTGGVQWKSITLDAEWAAATDPEGDAISYTIELDTSLTFSTGNLQTATGPAQNSIFTLVENTWYWLRLRASDGTLQSEWETVNFFANVVNDAPPAPEPLVPSNGAEVTTWAPELSVAPVTDPENETVTYSFGVYGDAGLTQLIAQTNGASTNWTISVALTEDTNYYWIAWAVDEHGLAGPTSAAQTFRPNVLPPEAGTIAFAATPIRLFANGISESTIVMTVTDDQGLPVVDGTLLTISVVNGSLLASDASGTDPDVQVATADGQATFNVRSLTLVGTLQLHAAALSGGTYNDLTIPLDNTPPRFNSTPVATATESALYNYTVVIFDYQGPVTIALLQAPDGFTIATGTVEGTPTYGQVGVHTVRLRATDTHGVAVFQEYELAIAFADSDADGLPDTWEQLYFATLTQAGTGDPDADGLTNAQEFAGRSDPSVFNGPGTPGPILADGARVASLTPLLTVSAASDPDGDALTYRYEVFTDAALTNLVRSASGQNLEWSVTPALTENQTYYWRASASDPRVQGAYSSIHSFLVDAENEAPTEAYFTNVTDGEQWRSLTLLAEWAASADPEGDLITYEVELDTALTFSTGSLQTASVTTRSTLFSLVENTWYWLRVQASDGDLQSNWESLSFYANAVNDAPPAPAALSPADGAEVATWTPLLSIAAAIDPEGEGVTYSFAVYADPGLTQLIVQTSGAATNWTISSTLAEDTNYYWIAWAVDEHGLAGPASMVKSFRPNVLPPDAETISFAATPAQLYANGISESTIVMTVADAQASPVVDGTLVTLSLTNGTLLASDVSVSHAGVQVATTGGQASFQVRSTTTVGALVIHAAAVSGSTTSDFTILLDNTPPRFDSTPPGSATENMGYVYVIDVFDYQGPVTIALLQAPNGFTIAAGTMQGAPTYNQVGMHTIRLRGTDSHGAVVYQEYQLGIAFQDTDNDGLPDTWEMNYLGTLAYSAHDDNDGDGVSNLAEFIRASDPASSNAPTAPSIHATSADGIIFTTLRPLLSVNNAVDADVDPLTYSFWLYDDAALANLVTTATGIAEGTNVTYWMVPLDLQENQGYWWRSSANDGFVYGPYTQAVSFHVDMVDENPSAPQLLTPADGSEVASQRPTLTVTNGTDPEGRALHVRFEIFDEGMATPLLAADITAGATTTAWPLLIDLSDSGTYDWRAQMVDAGGNGSAWMTATFHINLLQSNAPPPMPLFTSISDGQEWLLLDGQVQWTPVLDPDGDGVNYRVQLDSNESFATAEMQSKTTSGTEALFGFTDNTDVWLRIRAEDFGTSSAWNTIRLFVNSENDLPGTPALASPTDGGQVTNRQPTLAVFATTDIDRDELTYAFSLFADAAGTQLVASNTDITAPTAIALWKPESALKEDSWHYWQAWAVDEHGFAGSRTPLFRFRVNATNNMPSAPYPKTPGFGARITGSQPTLTVVNAVDPEADPLTYTFEIYDDSAMKHKISGATAPEAISTTSWRIGKTLILNHAYFWRVRADDGHQAGAWSDTSTFQTPEVDGPDAEVPVEDTPQQPRGKRKSGGCESGSPSETILWASAALLLCRRLSLRVRGGGSNSQKASHYHLLWHKTDKPKVRDKRLDH